MNKYMLFLAGFITATLIGSLSLNFYFLRSHPLVSPSPSLATPTPEKSPNENPAPTQGPAVSDTISYPQASAVKAKDDNGTFAYPQAIAVGPKGDLYIVDLGNNRVVILHPDGTALRTFPILPRLGQSTGIAVSPSGDIYVAGIGRQRVLVFNPDGTLSKTITDLSPLSPNRFGSSSGEFPQGIALSPNGTIYVADESHQRIVVLRPDGTATASFSNVAPFEPPTLSDVLDGIAVSPDGKIYVSDHEYNRIVVFNPDGKALKVITGLSALSPGQWHGPRGMVFSPEGDLFVTDCYNGRVVVLDAGDKALRAFSTGYGCPQGIIFSPATGYLYTAQSDDSVIGVFNPNGTPRPPIQSFQPQKP